MCDHYEIVNQHEGETVCCLCGFVLNFQHFSELQHDNLTHDELIHSRWADEAKNILDRMHLPLVYAEKIVKHLNENYKAKNTCSLAYSVYKVLNNDYMVPITLQEVCDITGARKKSIFMQQPVGDNIILDKTEFVERYCYLLGLDFKKISLVKEMIAKQKPSGHSPTTIIAGCIYLSLKKLNHKISIKKVSEITRVSSISIQRFIKNVNT